MGGRVHFVKAAYVAERLGMSIQQLEACLAIRYGKRRIDVRRGVPFDIFMQMLREKGSAGGQSALPPVLPLDWGVFQVG